MIPSMLEARLLAETEGFTPGDHHRISFLLGRMAAISFPQFRHRAGLGPLATNLKVVLRIIGRFFFSNVLVT